MNAAQLQPAYSAPPGRNDVCPCGSGKKFKRCCMEKASGSAQSVTAPMRRSAAPDMDAQVAAALRLKQQGKTKEAITLLRSAAQMSPGSYAANFQLGSTLAQTGSFEEAAQALSRAIQLRPQSAEAIGNLGAVFRAVGSHERAITCFRKALELQPGYAPALSNLGSSFAAIGQHDEAIAALQSALESDPRLVDAYVNFASALVTVARYDEAIACCQHGLKLSPGDPELLLNLGNAYKERGQLALAEMAYGQMIAKDPQDARAFINLGDTLRDHGRIAGAGGAYRRALQLEPHSVTAYSNMLYLHAFTHNLPQAEELELARGWEQAVIPAEERAEARRVAHRSAGVFSERPLAGRKLRVGIVSAELGSHAVAEFLQPLLENLDRERFHLTLFPSAYRSEGRAAHLLSLSDAAVPLRALHDAAAVEAIRRQEIDVLMDTSGHTAANRLGIFARRAAPVQCTYIGYWGTTGLTEMDWFISDPDAPVASEAGFSEGLWRLPRIAVSYRGDTSLDCGQWKPDSSGAVWLGSLNKFAKIREETLELWAAVLRNIPEAKLLLEDRGSHDEDSHERILGGLAQHGVSAERVEFVPYVAGHERHMLLYNRLDIALDTVPFNSGTTAFDALWMGVPLVTLEGDWGNWIGGRMGASTLRALGRPEWIARTAEEYVEIVRGLARDVELRSRLREQQRSEMAASQLTDAPELARALGAAFLGMYDRWLAEQG